MPEPSPAQDGGGIKSTIKSVLQGLLIMMGIQFIIGQFSGKKSSTGISYNLSGNSIGSEDGASKFESYYSSPKDSNNGMKLNSFPNQIAPIWPGNTLLDIVITISPNFKPEPIFETKEQNVVLNETAFRFGDYNDEREINVSFDVPRELQNNGTLWGHFFIGISGENLDPFASNYNAKRSFHFDWPLTQYLNRKKMRKEKNLLAKSDNNEEEPVEEEHLLKTTIISHYHPNFTISFIPDTGVLAFPRIHPAMKQYFHLKSSDAIDGTYPQGWYYPVLFVNTFWQLKSHMISLNSTVNRLPLNIKLNNMANWKFGILSSLDHGAKQAAKASTQGTSFSGGGDGSELEMIKEVLLDTNPYLLATTVAVSIVHMIFEMLAFKSDISHYRNKKNNVGISIRSILGNVFMQAVILLYLLDNNENTSWMILLSQGMGILLELWKITTIVNICVRPSDNIFGFKVAFEDKHTLSITEEKTKEYDAVAFKYLYMVAIPLLLAYAAYSLAYETHRSWYSFIIATLVGSVYAYGFLMMVPSLYINYRLKSVAHMPAKAMTYKFLNTFIDDLFAFTIKMPTLHRIATLRDDLIFFVYLYQSWKYKTDYTRVNEFGQTCDDLDVNSTAIKSLETSPESDKISTESIEKSNRITPNNVPITD
ncbi:Cleft lip and palate transmembrane protein 1 [Erysiphe neolycopersici]|uniref:Cleft lip and palate transmembrane protein 1 n=1 Tax=Erysiphe neolycopersici TaxID=212602 RepID=A0A420HAD9_9PEZI|nr:Cleft lip and palate transmembrane protein 1 [Erysiphe neolycopersici]